MISDIHGDQACPVILTVHESDPRGNELAKLAWRARIDSGELPLIFLNPKDDSKQGRLAEWTEATARHNAGRTTLIHLTSPWDRDSGSENVTVTVNSALHKNAPLITAIDSLLRSHGLPSRQTEQLRTHDEPFSTLHNEDLLDTIYVHVPESISGCVESDPMLNNLVRFVADLILRGCGGATIDTQLPDYFALLAAFNVNDRGALSREINRRLDMPPGLGIEFYYESEDDLCPAWIGLGGQGDGFGFPASVSKVLAASRAAYADYSGDFYHDLKFDPEWRPAEPADEAQLAKREVQLDGIDLSQLARLLASDVEGSAIAEDAFRTIQQLAGIDDLGPALIEYLECVISDLEDEIQGLDNPDDPDRAMQPSLIEDHDEWELVLGRVRLIDLRCQPEADDFPIGLPIDEPLCRGFGPSFAPEPRESDAE